MSIRIVTSWYLVVKMIPAKRNFFSAGKDETPKVPLNTCSSSRMFSSASTSAYHLKEVFSTNQNCVTNASSTSVLCLAQRPTLPQTLIAQHNVLMGVFVSPPLPLTPPQRCQSLSRKSRFSVSCSPGRSVRQTKKSPPVESSLPQSPPHRPCPEKSQQHPRYQLT